MILKLMAAMNERVGIETDEAKAQISETGGWSLLDL